MHEHRWSRFGDRWHAMKRHAGKKRSTTKRLATRKKAPSPTAAPPGSAWPLLVDAIESLASARSLDRVVEIVRDAARGVSQADGVTFVLRDGDRCHYVDENAIGPLWKGQKFPMSACISGWAMLNRRTAVVPDIYVDDRIPHDAYRPTFVKSLMMVPVGNEEPIAAIGAYWARRHDPDGSEIALLESLARATATAVANVTLEASLRDAAERASAQAAEIRRAYEETKSESERRQQTEAQLRQAQKMEAVGQLTGGLAHDFNNLLAVIIGNLDLLAEDQTKSAPTGEAADAALEAALRGAELTRQLLAFSRRQPLQPKQVDINGLVANLTGMMKRILGENIVIATRLAERPWPAIIDPTQLETALMNMAINARDAMPNGGRLTIEADNAQLDDDYVSLNPEAIPGEYVRLSVSDTGSGIPPEILEKVFEPFFTTKPAGQGTGLGLSMIYGFVKQSHGHIKIYSEVGVGTTVRLYLPRADGLADVDEHNGDAPAMPMGRGETVLVVEDKPAVRRIVCRQLARLGYVVRDVGDAEAARAALRSDDPFDLLFTDVILPGSVSGVDLAREARSIRPSLKVLYTSGFPDAARIGGSFSATDVLLSKPYRLDDLARKIHQVLSARG